MVCKLYKILLRAHLHTLTFTVTNLQEGKGNKTEQPIISLYWPLYKFYTCFTLTNSVLSLSLLINWLIKWHTIRRRKNWRNINMNTCIHTIANVVTHNGVSNNIMRRLKGLRKFYKKLELNKILCGNINSI